MRTMIVMLAVADVFVRLRTDFAILAEMPRHQRSGAMVAAAFDGFLDRRGGDLTLVVDYSDATGNWVDGR